MEWHYEGKKYELPEDYDHKDVYGFVYLITNRATGKKYVGKKFFWSKKTLPITKTRKRRKRLLVESDWKTYYGSNKNLQEDVEKMGEDFFYSCLLYTSPSPRDPKTSRMPSSA